MTSNTATATRNVAIAQQAADIEHRRGEVACAPEIKDLKHHQGIDREGARRSSGRRGRWAARALHHRARRHRRMPDGPPYLRHTRFRRRAHAEHDASRVLEKYAVCSRAAENGLAWGRSSEFAPLNNRRAVAERSDHSYGGADGLRHAARPNYYPE